MAHHRTIPAVIHLPLFARGRLDHRMRLRHPLATELDDEASHALVAVRELAVVDQVLPDRHRVTAVYDCLLDELAMRFAGAGRRAASGHRTRVGEHLYGRF